MTDQLTRTPSAVRVVLASPLYRGATVALFLSGLGFSAAAPQIAQFLVRDLGASLTTAGLYYLTNLTAPVAGYLIGRRSDRTGRRLGLFRICAVAGFAGWLAIAYSGALWMPFVISAVVLGFAGAATSQLFAAIHDELAASPTPAADGVVSIVRMALTLGWVIGPVAGAFLAAQAGLRTMLVATAVCTLAQIVPLGTLRERVDATADDPDAPRPVAHVPVRAMAALLAFTGLFILVYAGEPIKYAYLPIYMNDQLHFPAALSGAIIGIQPLVELVLMPVAVVVARRMGMLPLMVLGALFGVGANLLFATTGTALGLFAGQVLMGGVWGVFAGLGIIVAQRLLPAAIATASAIYLSAPALSSAVGGLAGGLGAGALGLPLVFVIPAALALVAAGGLVVLNRKGGERVRG
ncbi:MFS transporter [Leifsonia sp. NPDC056665]|uniref:MFS transporter n=1 Tax=Leifsonia sp. NPDC056665 TaxID=3345901 RepID=UPI0036B1C751